MERMRKFLLLFVGLAVQPEDGSGCHLDCCVATGSSVDSSQKLARVLSRHEQNDHCRGKRPFSSLDVPARLRLTTGQRRKNPSPLRPPR